jgi:hypothetical protein
MVAFFLLIGAEKSQILTLSLLYGLVVLAASLPGGIVSIRSNKPLRYKQIPENEAHLHS